MTQASPVPSQLSFRTLQGESRCSPTGQVGKQGPNGNPWLASGSRSCFCSCLDLWLPAPSHLAPRVWVPQGPLPGQPLKEQRMGCCPQGPLGITGAGVS